MVAHLPTLWVAMMDSTSVVLMRTMWLVSFSKALRLSRQPVGQKDLGMVTGLQFNQPRSQPHQQRRSAEESESAQGALCAPTQGPLRKGIGGKNKMAA